MRAILWGAVRNMVLLGILILVFAGSVAYFPDSQWEACIALPDRCNTEVSVPGRGPNKPNPNNVIPNP